MKRSVVIAAAVVVLCLLGPGAIQKSAAVPPPPPPTTFLCYQATAPQAPGRLTLTLTDQWGAKGTRLAGTSSFCNPADKLPNPASAAPDFVAATHLTCYRIYDLNGPFQRRVVQETDQFGSLSLAIQRAHSLCVPSNKQVATLSTGRRGTTVGTAPLVSPVKCYSVDGIVAGGFKQPTLRVTDQYIGKNVREVTVLRPVLFCNPVEKSGKTVGTGQSAGIPGEHLTCYRITRWPFTERDQGVANQFGTFSLRVRTPQTLCVDATKVVGP